MAEEPSKNPKKPVQTDGNPKPEVLKPREQDATTAARADAKETRTSSKLHKLPLRSRSHLSHKATFTGLIVVVIILGINAAIIALVIRNQPEDGEASANQVTVNQEALESLGVNQAIADDTGVELVVGPNASFGRSVEIAGGLSVGGRLVLNDDLSATQVSATNLQAGNVELSQLNVSGDGTLTNLSIRQDISVAGTTRLQGPVTLDQLLTVNNNANIAGNVTVGGALSVNAFRAGSLTVDGTITIGGQIITRGSSPSASTGPAVGSNGTVSVSGNDTSGTVGFNAGVGAGNGIVARVNFSRSYSNIPHVVITPIGNVGNFYIFRDRNGFSIGVGNSVSPGGYAFDYIVMQ